MDPLAHEKLIAALAAKLATPVPPEGFQTPYFQAAWALIKKIGPAFKATAYAKRSARDAAWTKFQAAVEELKRRQKVWEERSLALQTELLATIERARPPGTSMAQLLAPPAAPPPPAPASSVPLSARARRRAELTACATAATEALRHFNTVKHHLSHAHFQVVSRELREVRAQVDRAWTRFQEERATRPAARRPRLAAPLRKLTAAIENDEACLASKRQTVADLQKLLTKTTADKERTRLHGWIEKESAAIAELEKALVTARAQLAAATAEKPAS